MTKQHWIVIRLIECRLMAHVAPDDWAPVGLTTWVTDDREKAYQAARRLGGLLLRANGLPSPKQVYDLRSGLESVGGDTAGLS